MTASFTLTGTGEYYPSGTSVAVYPRAAMIPEHPPSGQSVTVAVSGTSSVVFSGLEFSTAYVAYALLGGQYRYKTFATDAASNVVAGPAGPAGADGATFGGIYDVKTAPYNAVGDGVADDRAAIQAALDHARSVGGTVYFPKGVYKVTAPLTLNNSNTWGVKLLGCAPVMNFDMVTSELRYTGATGSLLDVNSGDNIEIANLGFTYTNPLFTGDLIDCDGNVPLASDIQELHIHHCGTLSRAGSNTARSGLRLERVIISSVDHCHFGGGNYGLYLGAPPGSGGSFIGETFIEKCTFNRNNNAHIFIGTGDGETIVIRDNTFEAGVNTTAIRGATPAVDGAGNQNALYSPVIECNWFGDASAPTKWIDGLNTINLNFPGRISSNRFGDTVGGTHLTLTGAWTCIANSFDGLGTVYGGSASGGYGNGYDSNLTLSSSPNPAGMVELGSSQQNNNAPNRMPYRVWYGPNVNEAIVDHGEEGLIVAVNYTYTPIGFATAGVVSYGGNVTRLTAPQGSGGAVALCAGPASADMVVAIVSGGVPKLGFFNVTPVAQPARAGQLTDSTGGSASGTLAAGITDAVAKNAIASLAAKVNALEAIIHNLGLSA